MHSVEERWQTCASENIVKTNYYNNLNAEGQKQWLQVRVKGSSRKKRKRKMSEESSKKVVKVKVYCQHTNVRIYKPIYEGFCIY